MSAVSPFGIMAIRPDQYKAVGTLLVETHLGLPGMPSREEQPGYYDMMTWVALRHTTPSVEIYVALSASGDVIGTVDFVGDLRHYGSVTRAVSLDDAAGIRFLAVAPDYRGFGIAQSLSQFCMERAFLLGKSQIVLHSALPMRAASSMFERLGFARLRSADCWQGELKMLGYSLPVKRRPKCG